MEHVYQLESLNERIQNEQGLLIYFSTDSCSVCKVLKPKVAELLQTRFTRMAALYADTDKSPLIAGQYRVFTIPTILLFFGGKEHLRFSRNISLYQLEEAIERPYRLVFED